MRGRGLQPGAGEPHLHEEHSVHVRLAGIASQHLVVILEYAASVLFGGISGNLALVLPEVVRI